MAGTAASSALVTGSTPYPWPYGADFEPARVALLVISTDSPLPAGDDPAWAVVDGLVRALQDKGGLVIDVHCHRPMAGQNPTAVADSRRVPGADYLLDAPGWNAFYATALDRLLRVTGRDQLLLSGAWLEVGVHSTMRAANDQGYECLLIQDACVAADSAIRPASLSSIEMSGGIFGAVGSSAGVLALL